MYLSSVDSFLQGIKPSCYENRANLDAIKLDELSVYPSFNDNEEFTLYFRDGALKQYFIMAVNGKDRKSPEYIREFGDILGYPPKATAFFADYQAKRTKDAASAATYFQNVKVNMLYCGVQFMSHVDDVEENALWLWNRYECDRPMRFKLMQLDEDPVQITVPFRNFDKLKRGVNDCFEFHHKLIHT